MSSKEEKNDNKKNLIEHLLLIAGLFDNSNLIEMSCCCYNINKKQMSSETSFYIKPNNNSNINDLIEKSKIDKNKQPNPQYISLEECLDHLNKLIKDNFVNKNNNFGIIYVNKDLLNILKEKLEIKNIIIFNLFEVFNENYHKKCDSLNKILSELNLKQNNNLPPCPKELKTMTRIINKMIKNGKVFYIPENLEKNLDSSHKLDSNLKNDIIIQNININENKENKEKNNSMDIELNQLETTNSMQDIQCYYIRFKNFPDYINKIDIKDLLYQYDIEDNDIVLSYNILGKRTGDIIMRLYNTDQYKEIFSSYNFYKFNDEFIIELFESNSQEFSICSRSNKFISQNIRSKNYNIFMKVSKISQSTTESDLKSFFKNNSIVEDGIKFNRHSSNGEAIIIFETEEECLEAIQKNNGRLLKNQSISLSESNLDEFEEFAGTMALENWLPILSDLINTEDVRRTLYLFGFPLDVNTNQIVQFLSQFNLSHSNLIVIDKILKNYGSIIIKFYNEDIANEAKNWIKNNRFRNKNIYAENLLSVINKGNANL